MHEPNSEGSPGENRDSRESDVSDEHTFVDLRRGRGEGARAGEGEDEAGEAAEETFRAGDKIARYTVLETIGSGGVGIVYACYDADLDRKVALKLLRASKRGGNPRATKTRRRRMLREAQALARLSHPNVVPIYEVGTFDGQIYLAMEFVEGTTLIGWLEERPRAWAEIVDVFIQAGEGLCSAHQGGIVHRDFKPENVLVGDDGRVRVLDFGLAALRRAEADESGEDEQMIFEPSRLEHSSYGHGSGRGPAVTREGQVMGTPAYMAPEQAAGAGADARSDQFSFCVAMYEALYGVRPFHGRFDDPRRWRSLERLRSLPGTRPADMPASVERVLVHGLSLEPGRRFANMAELLVGLQDAAAGPRRRQRWLRVSLMAGVALVLGVLLVELVQEVGSSELVCEDGAAMFEGIWDPGVRDEFHQRALVSNLPYAERTWTTIAEGFEGWSESWRAARLQACEATRLRGEQTVEVLDLRLACLDRQLVRFKATLDGLRARELDPEALLDQLIEQRERLPSPERCDALSILERGGSEHAQVISDEVREELLERIASVEGLIDAASYDEAVARAEGVVDDARELGDAPLEAEALRILGLALHGQASDPERTRAVLREAAVLAQRSGAERVFVGAATALIDEHALGHVELAGLWAELARATLDGLGGDVELEIDLLLALGDLAMVEGDYEQALDHHRRVLELVRERSGERHPTHLRALRKLSDDLRELGRFAEATEILERTREQAAEVWGPKHPEVARTLDALANVLTEQSRLDEALTLAERSLAINEELGGPSSAAVARTLNSIAIIHDEAGRYGEAARVLERARAILIARRGAEHPDVAVVEVNIGSAKQNLARYDEAIVHYEVARGILSESLGAEHVSVGVCLQNIGASQAERGILEGSREDSGTALDSLARAEPLLVAAFGRKHPAMASLEHNRAIALTGLRRYEEALAAEERALAAKEGLYGEDHVELVESLAWLSAIERALDHGERALLLARRAVSLSGEDNAPSERAQAQLALAAARFDLAEGDEVEEATARELARAGLAELERAEGAVLVRREIEGWLAAHGG
ncbi:serine/threonine protein kinase [Pseudenhygromyxa sp. WMMC2535]|uniref:serine/threonine-protein kinase n=1 Tax=Pseudenhygromyxa sp. WMMC2535 TaxID=2712867 RepID=UPI001557AF95|nr:serine/threonine-protein kinase [Pseudenhygromyxa sp. WMMC2535]NVB39206.1 serine/threonine protein kinase [Pseudenhygromyxa sp. WMMC2535]